MTGAPERLTPALAERFAALALDCVHRPYPNQVLHLLQDDGDARPPRSLTPAFYGCFDWHSAVHGHWLLARLARWFPEEPFAPRCREALARSLTEENLDGELRYLSAPGRESFERPYGLAWLVTLTRELRRVEGAVTLGGARRLDALEALAWRHLHAGFDALPRPVRSGLHGQTAFSLGLCFDAARDPGERKRLDLHALRLFLRDQRAPLAWEPSGYDFLSPTLAAADLLARAQPRAPFGRWLEEYLPGIPTDGTADWLRPEEVPNPADGHLVHLAGLDLSRAWMLEGIAAALPRGDLRRASLLACARAHAHKGLGYVSDQHYAGAHWLGTFALYLFDRRAEPRRL
ncbi:MAG: DUF2891 domain-containing protein [Deltaproteobacteria bacterium]|nr:DUF2891 domain-containing protein [Deltaproteobacteria bacterium]